MADRPVTVWRYPLPRRIHLQVVAQYHDADAHRAAEEVAAIVARQEPGWGDVLVNATGEKV